MADGLMKRLEAFVYDLWRRYLLHLCRNKPYETTYSLLCNGGHVSLKRGDYLCWAWSKGTHAVALIDGDSAARRIAWLLRPGFNVISLDLKNDWHVARWTSLGSEDGSVCETSLQMRSWWAITARFKTKLAPFLPSNVKLVGLGGYRELFPPPNKQTKSIWEQWASFVHELSILNIEDWIPPVLAGKYPVIRPAVGAIPEGERVGAHVHLHYLDVWRELREDLGSLPRNTRLFVTISEDAIPGDGITADSILAEVKREWANGSVRVVGNRGRDIAPLLQLLAEGCFDGLDCVCKIHGKKSFRAGQPTYLGEVWRRHLVGELISDPQSIMTIAQRFRNDQTLGILGPERVRLPSARVTRIIEDDKGLLLKLMKERFGTTAPGRLTFFAGTMFWFRPEAFAVFRKPPEGGWSFPPEPVSEVGSLAHALERLLPTAALLSGFKVENLLSRPL